MSNDQIRLNTQDRSDDQMMEIDLIPSDGRASHYAIASVVVRMDGMADDSPDLVSFAERLVSRYNACAGMDDPAAEIAELKRQRDELLGLVKAVSYHSIPGTVDGIKCAAFPWSEYESMVIKAKGGSS